MWTNMCGMSLEAQEGNNHMLQTHSIVGNGIFLTQRFMNFPPKSQEVVTLSENLHLCTLESEEIPNLGVPHHEA